MNVHRCILFSLAITFQELYFSTYLYYLLSGLTYLIATFINLQPSGIENLSESIKVPRLQTSHIMNRNVTMSTCYTVLLAATAFRTSLPLFGMTRKLICNLNYVTEYFISPFLGYLLSTANIPPPPPPFPFGNVHLVEDIPIHLIISFFSL